MATQTPQPVTHIFKEINKGKYRSVKHFELQQTINGKSLLSQTINLSKNRNYALSMPEYWLKIRRGNKWSKCITGLFKTEADNVYRGDVNKRQHLLLFDFSDDKETLTVYCYKDFFVRDISTLLEQFALKQL